MGIQFYKNIPAASLDDSGDIITLQALLGPFQREDLGTLRWDGVNHQIYLKAPQSPSSTIYINFDANMYNSNTPLPTTNIYPGADILQSFNSDKYFTSDGNLDTNDYIDENNSFLRVNNCSLFLDGFEYGNMFQLNCEFHGDKDSDGVLIILGTYDFITP